MAKTGLLDATGRGRFKITQRGQDLLTMKPDRIDRNTLIQYPEFRAFSQQTGAAQAPAIVLIDGAQLAELMMDLGVGVTTANTCTMKRLDLDYEDWS